MTGFHRSMFTRRSLTIVFVTNNDRSNSSSFVRTLCSRDRSIFTCQLVFNGVRFIVEVVNCSNQHVIGYVVQVATVFQPRTSHGNMVSSTFTFCFDQQFQPLKICTFPSREWCQ